MKSKLQYFIIVLGIISLCIGVWQMSQISTMIVASWLLILLFLVILLFLAFIFGYLLKVLLKSELYTITFASIFTIIICSIFYISRYRPTYKIIIPENYTGEVKLFISNEKENDFYINNYGIGYITRETFNKGFYPKIIKGKSDVTKQVKDYSKSSWITTKKTNYYFEYLSFSLLFKKEISQDKDVEELLKVMAIDTTRLSRK